jgi:hypothetical protein
LVKATGSSVAVRSNALPSPFTLQISKKRFREPIAAAHWPPGTASMAGNERAVLVALDGVMVLAVDGHASPRLRRELHRDDHDGDDAAGDSEYQNHIKRGQ